MKKKANLACMALIASVVAMLPACSDDDSGSSKFEPRQSIVLTDQTRTAAEDLRDFYARFTADMADYVDQKDGKDANMVVSPLSAAMVFSMAGNAVDDNQQKLYTDYLGVDDIQSLNNLCALLLEKLPSADRSATFRLPNSIWVNDSYGLSLSPEFSSAMTSKYSADIRHANFLTDNASTLKEMNRWCASATDNVIDSYFKDLNPAAMAIYLNALYFKAIWEEGIFDAVNTKDAVFHGTAGDTQVKMMASDQFSTLYACDDSFEYLKINFGNGAFAFEIVLPVADEGASASCPKLASAQLQKLREESASTLAKVYLPKFKVSEDYDLSGMLVDKGLNSLVNGLRMTMFSCSDPCAISYRQYTSFAVDENGAEAAAVTSGSVDPTAPGPSKLSMRVDRPFYFFINEYSTGACILSGRIVNL